MRIDEHPTVKCFREKGGAPSQLPVRDKLDAKWIGRLVLEAGADGVGLVEVDRPELADQRKDILTVFPQTSGFPMDLALWPGKMWPISHKPIAVAGGLG